MPSDLTSFRLLDFWTIAPEIVLAAWSLVILLADLRWFRDRSDLDRRTALGRLTLVGIGIAGVAALPMSIVRFDLYGLGSRFNLVGLDPIVDTDATFFLGSISSDVLTDVVNLIYLLILGLVVRMSTTYEATAHWGEYFALLLWSAVGMMLLSAAEEMATMFLSLELMTISLYLLTAFDRDTERSSEAGLKYFIYGSVASALLVFGMSLIYGLTNSLQFANIHRALFEATSASGLAGSVAGSTAVLLILVGFAFKLAVFPFHQWAPDAYDGAPTPVTTWLATASKMAGLLVFAKLLLHGFAFWSHGFGAVATPGWVILVAILAAGSMTYGNFAALAQTRLKRLLAYSSIAHGGYLLIGVVAAAVSRHPYDATAALLFYLGVYAFTNLSAFAVVIWLASDGKDDRIESLNGLGSRYPWLGLSILVLMLSLIGIPPFGGFFGKLWMFMEALNTGVSGQKGQITLVWLVALGLFNSVVSAIYYIKILKALYFKPENASPLGRPDSSIAMTIVLGAFLAIAMGVSSSPFLSIARSAGVALLTTGRNVQRNVAKTEPATAAPTTRLLPTGF